MKVKATCGLISLGCAKNLVDSEVMLGALRDSGYAITPNEDGADVLVVNTCGFITPAVVESTQAIRDAVERKRRDLCQAVVVTGCLVQRDVNRLRDEFPDVDAFIGLNEFPSIAEDLDRILGFIYDPSTINHQPLTSSVVHPLIAVRPDVWYVYDENTPRLRATPPWYAYIKISEGCDHRCAFCIIPRLRGDMRCRPMASIVTEAKRLADEGVKEVVLIAQDSTRYGMDMYGKPMLAELLRRLAAIESLRWIRVLYAYPLFINDEVVEVMTSHENICHYIDVPLQHSHPEILKAMQRAGSADSYRRMIDRLRMRLPDVAIRTTFIVGFPGETDAHFEHLKRFVTEVQFDRIGVFRYYPEAEAPSSQFDFQVESKIKEERAADLMKLQRRISRRRNQRLVGKELTVLLESRAEKKSDIWLARSEYDAPDIDAQVRVRGLPSRHGWKAGDFVRVRIARALDYDLHGWALT